jgi:hypothetical protein
MPNEIEIRHHIDVRREAITRSYLDEWIRMIGEWSEPRTDGAVWLMYSANYLVHARNTRWAVDPVFLGNRIDGAAQPDAAQDLELLDFVLLTHSHADHIDPLLWARLRSGNCRWIVPEQMIDMFTERSGIDESRITAAIPGREIGLVDSVVTPFASPHDEILSSGMRSGVAETGYFVETPCGSYLFPGDVRTYDPALLPKFSSVTAVFAHVFLGRGVGVSGETPLLDPFAKFYTSFQPAKIILSHLYEYGRGPEDCWLEAHAGIAARAIDARVAETQGDDIEILIPDWYRETML